jgi:site-specific recombinase XerC
VCRAIVKELEIKAKTDLTSVDFLAAWAGGVKYHLPVKIFTVNYDLIVRLPLNAAECRLHEKRGKEHEVPCHHNREKSLDEYIAAADIAGEPDAPLFQTSAGKTGTLTGKTMWQQDAYRMIQRRTRGTGIKT